MMKKRIVLSLWLLLASGSVLAGGIEVEGGLTRAYTVQPGRRIEPSILLRNHGAETSEVKAYQTDYLFFSDGKNSYGEPGSVPRSNCSWVTFSPQQLVVPANGTSFIHYAVQSPNNEKLTGTYWSMLMILSRWRSAALNRRNRNQTKSASASRR